MTASKAARRAYSEAKGCGRGSTDRRSYDAASSNPAIHMVSAWATGNCISPGQVVVDEKSNEITAIPKSLKLLEIGGSLVAIDAIGGQTEIAEMIVACGADYCPAAKGNRATLYDGIAAFYKNQMETEFLRHEGAGP